VFVRGPGPGVGERGWEVIIILDVTYVRLSAFSAGLSTPLTGVGYALTSTDWEDEPAEFRL